MRWEIDAFGYSSIGDALELIYEYKFRLVRIQEPIRVKIYRHVRADGVLSYWAEASHTLVAPGQNNPLPNSSGEHADVAHVLRRAVDAIVLPYDDAIASGHAPSETWLVRTEGF